MAHERSLGAAMAPPHTWESGAAPGWRSSASRTCPAPSYAARLSAFYPCLHPLAPSGVLLR